MLLLKTQYFIFAGCVSTYLIKIKLNLIKLYHVLWRNILSVAVSFFHPKILSKILNKYILVNTQFANICHL